MKNLIDRERLRENRNRIAEKNKAGLKDLKVAPAKGDGRPGRKGSPSRGRSSEKGGKGDKICFKFQVKLQRVYQINVRLVGFSFVA